MSVNNDPKINLPKRLFANEVNEKYPTNKLKNITEEDDDLSWRTETVRQNAGASSLTTESIPDEKKDWKTILKLGKK